MFKHCAKTLDTQYVSFIVEADAAFRSLACLINI
jgi:hypothetical protein